eukprot:5496327-Amphidinium_carterae.1
MTNYTSVACPMEARAAPCGLGANFTCDFYANATQALVGFMGLTVDDWKCDTCTTSDCNSADFLSGTTSSGGGNVAIDDASAVRTSVVVAMVMVTRLWLHL